MKKILTLSLILTCGLFFAGHTFAAKTTPAEQAGQFLIGQQESSGMIGNIGLSGWAIQALAATGQDTSRVLGYINGNLGDMNSASATDIERTILAVLAGGQDPRSSGGHDLVELLKQKSVDGQIGSPNLANDDIFGILALLAAGESVTDSSVSDSLRFLAQTQRQDGSFGWNIASGGDSNNTAVAIQAFELAKRRGWIGSYNREAAISYLKSAQNDDGGFSFFPAQVSDASSTGWATSAIISLGQSPESWARGDNNPYSYLQSLQANSGGIKWRASEKPDILTTSYAAIALAGKALPVAVLTAPEPSPSPQPSPSPLPLPPPSPSPIPTVTPIHSPSPSPVPSPSPTPTPSPSPSPSPAPSRSLSPNPAITPTPAASASPSPITTPTPSHTAQPSPMPSPSATTLQQVSNQSDTEVQEDEDAVVEIQYSETPTVIDKAREGIQSIFSPKDKEPVAENSSPITEITAEATASEEEEKEGIEAPQSPQETHAPLVAGNQDEDGNGSSGPDAWLMIAAGIILISWAALRRVYQNRMAKVHPERRF